MDKFRVTFRNPRTENKDLQCEPAFPATSAEDARDHFINVLEMVAVTVEPVEDYQAVMAKKAEEYKAFLARMNSPEMVARRGTYLTPTGWKSPALIAPSVREYIPGFRDYVDAEASKGRKF